MSTTSMLISYFLTAILVSGVLFLMSVTFTIKLVFIIFVTFVTFILKLVLGTKLQVTAFHF